MKTYVDQVFDHLSFLQDMGLEVHALQIGKFVRCRKLGRTQGRGDYTYHCYLNPMQQNRVGLITWCRGKSGKEAIFKTYGLSSEGLEPEINHASFPVVYQDGIEEYDEAIARKALIFWQQSFSVGLSCYLIRKGVGAYGIRFRTSKKYGNAAIVPMFDENDKLWSYQILNKDGSKHMMTGSRIRGLFHKLQDLINGEPIGIAESYVTAATCFELSGIPTVCAFSCENLLATTKILRKLYPLSPLFLFADNDRHLEQSGGINKGIAKALETIKSIDKHIQMIAPDFKDSVPSKETSDWNDLFRLKGKEFTRAQIIEKLSNEDLLTNKKEN